MIYVIFVQYHSSSYLDCLTYSLTYDELVPRKKFSTFSVGEKDLNYSYTLAKKKNEAFSSKHDDMTTSFILIHIFYVKPRGLQFARAFDALRQSSDTVKSCRVSMLTETFYLTTFVRLCLPDLSCLRNDKSWIRATAVVDTKYLYLGKCCYSRSQGGILRCAVTRKSRGIATLQYPR